MTDEPWYADQDRRRTAEREQQAALKRKSQIDAAVERERERLRAILGSEWAQFDSATAANLALRTSMPAEQAVEVLRRKEMQHRQGLFAQAMNTIPNPTVGVDAERPDSDESPSPAYPHGMTAEEAAAARRILSA